MKPNFIPITVAAGLLLAATNSGWALAPRQHSVSGVVEAINCASRTITLKPKNEAAPLTLVWNDSTRFTKKGGCARCSFDSGQAIRVSYRREVGQNVLRRVSLRSDAATGCKPGGCCAPAAARINQPSVAFHEAKKGCETAKGVKCGTRPGSRETRSEENSPTSK